MTNATLTNAQPRETCADRHHNEPSTLPRRCSTPLTRHPGCTPAIGPPMPKGLMCSGTFTPSPEAAKLTRAPHANRPSTPVTVRFSDSTGLPTIPG